MLIYKFKYNINFINNNSSSNSNNNIENNNNIIYYYNNSFCFNIKNIKYFNKKKKFNYLNINYINKSNLYLKKTFINLLINLQYFNDFNIYNFKNKFINNIFFKNGKKFKSLYIFNNIFYLFNLKNKNNIIFIFLLFFKLNEIIRPLFFMKKIIYSFSKKQILISFNNNKIKDILFVLKKICLKLKILDNKTIIYKNNNFYKIKFSYLLFNEIYLFFFNKKNKFEEISNFQNFEYIKLKNKFDIKFLN